MRKELLWIASNGQNQVNTPSFLTEVPWFRDALRESNPADPNIKDLSDRINGERPHTKQVAQLLWQVQFQKEHQQRVASSGEAKQQK